MIIFTASKILPTLVQWARRKRLLHCAIALLLLSVAQDGLSLTPDCPIVTANFNGLADGTTVNNSATGWSVDAINVPSGAIFAVKSNRFHVQEIGGIGVWRSKVFSVAGYANFQVATKISSEGDLNSSEYVKIYYKIDGGSEVLMDQRTGNFGTIDFISAALTGNNVQIIVRLYNYNNGGSQTSKYYIEEYRVFKEDGPCASSISVSASANPSVLTCTTTSSTLSASSTASGVTYSWTGPGGFTSTAQNPVVSVGGTYTVTGTSSAGSGSASVTITENKTPPDLTATGGTLACGSSVTLNASSSVSGVTYSWSGPGGFTSTSRTPVVSTAGTYTVTVTNPANGCTASQSVTVSSGGAATPSAFWTEDFASLANGTTADNGATKWTASTTGSGTFSVQSNEFMAAFNAGNTAEGVWTSEAVDISGRTNVVVTVALKSSTTTTNDAFENSDYINVYYKLNGGSETAFFNDVAGLNGTTNGTATATATSPMLNGSTLQVVIRLKNTDPTERYYFDNIVLTGTPSGSSSVTIATSVSGVVTCTSTAQITATPNGTVSSYSWTGPNGFTSTAQNPVVSAGGQYTLTATIPGGCAVQVPVTVTENKAIPDLSASGGSLACATSFTLNANSTVANATYSWTGPNAFTSTSKNPAVTSAGTYTVTVTNPANGCTASQSVQVTAASSGAFWTEDFASLANGTISDDGATKWTASTTGSGTFSVQNNEFMASFVAGNTAEGIWTSGIIDISALSNVVIAVDLKSGTSSTNDALETSDYINVYYKLNGGSETAFFNDTAGLNGTTNGTATAVATSPALNGSTVQIVIRLKNTDPTERYYFDNVRVTGTNQGGVNASASVSGTLTCSTPSVTLNGSSTTAGVTYSWTGPNGFTSTAQNPAVSAIGTYTLLVTNGAGCSAAAVVNVTGNTTAPGATVSASGSLSCSGNAVTLSGSSSTAGVTYSWTGPNGFTSTAQNPTVSVAGIYTLMVTNPANGCTSTQSVQVTATGGTSTLWLEQFTMSNGTTVDDGETSWSIQSSTGTFAVSGNEFRGTNIGTASGVHAAWTSGVIDISGKTNVSILVGVRSAVSEGGLMDSDTEYADYIRVYYKLNGGSNILLGERTGSIENHSTTPTILSIGGLSGSTLQIIVKVKATGSDEFYYFDNVTVNATGQGTIDAAAAVSGPLTCATTSVTLSGSSSVSGVTYSWTGPNNFTSTAQNPVVSAPGTYTLTVSNGACTGTATVTVVQNITPPGATASVSGSLSCSGGSVTLSGSSPTSGVTYSWTGPNGFTSTAQNPTVSAVGTYTLTVRNPVNGCTSTQSVQVTSATSGTIWLEEFSLSNGTTVDNGETSWSIQSSTGSFNVQSNEFRVTNIGTASGVHGVWTSEVIDISGLTNVSISVNVRSSVINNAVMNTEGEIADYIRFYYKLNGAPHVLIDERLGAINNHSTTSTTLSINSLSGSTLQILMKVKATGDDEFYYFDNVKVTGTSQGTIAAAAAVSGPLTCATTSVTLSGSSSVSGVTYSWTGPNNFTSTAQNPVVSAPGTYTLTVSNGACTGTATVTVVQDITPPGATASVSGSISCSTTSVTLSGSSPTSGVTYSWTGPSGFTSTAQNPVVSATGTYTLTVTNPANGCTSTHSVQVTSSAGTSGTLWLEEFTLANGTTSDNGTTSWTTQSSTGTFAVSGNEFRVTDIGTTPGVHGVWTSDLIDISGKTNVGISLTVRSSITNNAVMNGSGEFADYIKVYYKINGGAEVLIGERFGIINNHSTTPTTLSVGSLSGTSLQIIMKGKATGNDEFYYLDDVKVTGTGQDTPIDATATVSGPLTCAATSVTLSGSSSVSGVTYSWTGPNNFTSTAQNPTVSVPGTYILTVSSGGCTGTATVNVTQNNAVPTATATASGAITCTTASVTLTATSNTSGVTYSWSGPGTITNPTSATPTVSTVGTYTVTVRNPANGCSTTASVTVQQNTTAPAGVTATASGAITCTTSSVTLTATSTTSGVTYSWSGPGTITNPNSATATVSTAGTYTVTVRNPSNGCTTTANITVQQNTTAPAGVTATASGAITCTTSSVTLTATSTTSGVTYSWSGPGTITNPTSATATVSTAGTYTVTVTNPANGCTATASVVVQQNGTVPAGVTATASGAITCTTSSVTLTATSTTSGVTYSWSGPGTITNPTSATATVSTAGTYTVTVTNPSNGCTSTASVTVQQNTTAPAGVTAAVSGVITCTTSSVTLTASSTTSGVTYSWTGPGTITNPNSATATVSTIGTYTVTVRNPSNGCSTTASVTVQENKTLPGVTASVSGTITCTTQTITLNATSPTANVAYSWTGPNGFTSSESSPTSSLPGSYVVTTKHPVSGCTSSATVGVTENKTPPAGVAASVSGPLNCTNGSVTLQGTSSTTGVSYQWTGPNGFTSTAQNPSVQVPGVYQLRVTNPSNGCFTTASVTVVENINVPAGVTASVSDKLTCTRNTVTITGASSTSGVTYSWTGPNNFSASTAVTNVSAPGAYQLTVFNPSNGCSIQASVTVLEDRTAPAGVTASGGTITCASPNVTLTVSSTTSNVTYHWTSPNGFSSNEQNPVVNVAGVYTVVVTSQATGCTTTATATIGQGSTSIPGGVSISGPEKLTCTASSITLTASSSASGVVYNWSGPGTITNPASASITVSVAGTYTVTATVPGSGCSATASKEITEDKVSPSVTATASAITCISSSSTLTASAIPGMNYSWSGPGTITNPTSATASTSATGTYTVVVTNPANGCTSSATAVVTQNTTAPNAGAISASSGFILTCYTNLTTLSCTSTTSGVTFKWTNSSGTVLSTTTSVAVSVPDTYTFTVTNPVNGCTTTRSRAVTQNRIFPTATVTPSGDITCSTPTVTLTGNSTGSPVTFSWAGPGPVTVVSTSATTEMVSVSVGGTYTLTITTPGNCIATANVTVNETGVLPNIDGHASGAINCENLTVTLFGESSTPDVVFNWTGPRGFESMDQNPKTTVPGNYTLSVTIPATGCTSSKVITVPGVECDDDDD